jgi:hypothetical protein
VGGEGRELSDMQKTYYQKFEQYFLFLRKKK